MKTARCLIIENPSVTPEEDRTANSTVQRFNNLVSAATSGHLQQLIQRTNCPNEGHTLEANS
jgi:hypothetical protein